MTALKRRYTKGLRHGRCDDDTSRQPPSRKKDNLFSKGVNDSCKVSEMVTWLQL